MYKKAIVIFMSAVMVLGVMAGCKGTTEPVTTGTPSTVSEQPQSSVDESLRIESSAESSAKVESSEKESNRLPRKLN